MQISKLPGEPENMHALSSMERGQLETGPAGKRIAGDRLNFSLYS